jgi:gluconate 2-dehydrogenase subunit 3-like protein
MSEKPLREKKQDAAWDEITRRQWILRLGEAAALVGFSGFAPEIAGALLSDETKYADLPPGLYLPSADTLVHALRGGHQQLVPPPGTETDYALPSALPSQPRFFSENEFSIVTRLAKITLGELDAAALSQTTQWIDLWFYSAAEVRQAARQLDPSHRALAVAYYGEPAVHDLETADPQAVARDGFSELRKLSEEKHGRGFLELDPPKQLELINSVRTAQPESTARKFFELIRSQAIHGYFTSAPGIAELDYKGNAYYPYCPGCQAADAHEIPGSEKK